MFNFMFASILIVGSGWAHDFADLKSLLTEHTNHTNGYICAMLIHVCPNGHHISRRIPQGTAVVIAGVIGIVAFGSINSGLKVVLLLPHNIIMYTDGESMLAGRFLSSSSVTFMGSTWLD